VGCERQGPFKIKSAATERVDYQIIKIDEPSDDKFGESSRSTTIDVELIGKNRINNDIAEGDRVQAIGELKIKAKDNDSDRTYNEHWINGTNIGHAEERVNTEDIEDKEIEKIEQIIENNNIWNVLTQSFAPDVKGVNRHKEALILSLFADAKGTGRCNIMLWGDPGEGKSELMDEVEKINPKSLVVDGKNASTVGLTAATEYMQIGGTRIPYAAPGALSMADGGVCGIDEFDKMDEEKFNSLLRSMQTGEVTVTKGGQHTTLPARANVVVTANPVGGNLDKYQPYAEQLGFEPYVLSRFDLIQVFEEEYDAELNADIMQAMMDSESGIEMAADGAGADIISYDMIRKWIAHAQANIDPVFSRDGQVRERLVSQYNELAKPPENIEDEDEHRKFKIDKRDAETLITLAQIIARIELCEEVKPRHANKAISMKLDSMQSLGAHANNLAKNEKRITQTKNAELVKAIIREEDVNREGLIMVANCEGLDPSESAKELDKLMDAGIAYTKDNDKLGLLN